MSRIPLLCLLALLLASPVVGSPSSENKVLTTTIKLHDSKRRKDLSVAVYYAAVRGLAPWIVFSHGEDETPRSYHHMAQFWAAHGYVVALPEHADALSKADAVEQTVQRLTSRAAWEDRVADMTLVMNDAIVLERKIPELKGKIAYRKLGVGGHSYGAFTSQMLAGAVLTLHDQTEPLRLRDDRPLAFLLLSPPGAGQQGLDEHSWDEMERPTLSMTGTYDFDVDNIPDWHMDGFRHSRPPDQYSAFIENAYHESFTDRGVGKEVLPLVEKLSLAFWDAYLKKEATAAKILDPLAADRDSDGKVRLFKK